MANEQLIQYLKEMEKDELKAPYDYQKIWNLLPNNSDRKKIHTIQKQEIRHHKIVKALLNKYNK